jgi:hypothetical protein
LTLRGISSEEEAEREMMNIKGHCKNGKHLTATLSCTQVAIHSIFIHLQFIFHISIINNFNILKMQNFFFKHKENFKMESAEVSYVKYINRALTVVINVLLGKVGTFLDKSMNLVPTLPHGPNC